MTADTAATRAAAVRATRASGDQRHPRPGHGRGAEGQLRASRHADGARAARARALHPHHALRREPHPSGPNRDRFVLSAGHASMLLYAMLYLTGYGLELDDLKQFRQFGSRTPGHPEHRHTPGVEVTTGPLGQGFANGVGMAIVERNLRERFGADVDRSPGVRDLLRRRPRGGRKPRGGIARRSPRAREASSTSTTTTTSRSTARPSSRTPMTSPARFEGYHWHVVQLGEVAEDLDALEQRAARGHGRGRPAHPADPAQPHRLPVTQVHRHRVRPRQRAGRRRGRARSRRSSGCPPEDFWVPDDVLAYYRDAGAARRATAARSGRSASQGWRERDGEPRRRATTSASRARGRPGWEQKLPDLEARRRDRDPRRPAARSSTRSSTTSPGSSAAAPTSPATPAPRSTAPASWTAATAAGASSTSGCASTAWARS